MVPPLLLLPPQQLDGSDSDHRNGRLQVQQPLVEEEAEAEDHGQSPEET